MKNSSILEARYLDLGDKRRNQRFTTIIENHINNPGGSIPEANRYFYGLKAEYNFYSNESVEEEKIKTAIQLATVERAAGHSILFILSDSTNISFGHNAEGLGYLDHGLGNGIMYHHSFVVTPDEEIIGEVHQNLWIRDREEMGKSNSCYKRNIEDKESYKWIEGIRDADLALNGSYMKVHIADRESDVFEVLATPLCSDSYFLIRATHNRKTSEGILVWDGIEKQKSDGHFDLLIERGKERKEREATIDIRYKKVKLMPPNYLHGQKPLELTAIMAEERNPPKGVEKVCWRLFTTLPVDSLEQAIMYVQWYSKRWLIERFHFVLKSGCKLEEIRLSTADQLRIAILTYTVIATQLMWLTYYARVMPDEPCTVAMEKYEWEALYFATFHAPPPKTPPTIREAVLWISKLGGFIGRKSDGDPGVKTIWRGLKLFNELKKMWNAIQNQNIS